MQPYDKHTSWVKSPWNYVNFLLESPLNSLDLDLQKVIEPCNLFIAKMAGILLKKNWVEALKKCHTILQNSQS